MAKVMINEKILRKDTIDGLMQFHGISEKRAKKICDESYMEKVMEVMWEAQSNYITNTKVKDKWVKDVKPFVVKDADVD